MFLLYTIQGRARAAKSKYCMLVEQHLLEKFQEELNIFKGIEQVSIHIVITQTLG